MEVQQAGVQKDPSSSVSDAARDGHWSWARRGSLVLPWSHVPVSSGWWSERLWFTVSAF